MRSPLYNNLELGEALFCSAPVPMWIYDEETLHFLAVNDAAVARYGYSRGQFFAMTLLDIRPVEEHQRLLDFLTLRDRCSPTLGGMLWHHVLRDGTLVDVEETHSKRIVHGDRPGIVVTVFDVTGREREAAVVRADRAALEEAHRAAELGSFIYDLRNKTYRVYGLLAEIAGSSHLSRSQAARLVLTHIHPADRKEIRTLGMVLRDAHSYEGKFRIRIGDEMRWYRGASRLLHDADGNVTSVIMVASDVSQAQAEEERLRRIAFTDAETGLPNRAALFKGQAIPDIVRGALLLVVADTGPSAAESRHDICVRNAKAVAAKLQSVIPAEATLARYGENIFAVYVSFGSRPKPRIPTGLARRIVEAFDIPLTVDGDEVVVEPSIGLGVSNEATDFATLARRASVALAGAEYAERRCAVYDAESEARQTRRAKIDRHLRQAIADNRVSIAYQPVVSVASRRIVGAEALMRWNCPEVGPVPPAEFIAIAEESGVIVRLGEWIIRESCAQTRRWEIAGLGALRIAVNVSAREVQQRKFVRLIATICEHTGLTPLQLELEVTERLMLDRGGLAVRNLEALRQLGVRVSVDDFGTGYSSLSYLSHIPLDVVKIDRSFVAPIVEDAFQAKVAENVIALAHERRLRVTGEGVEQAAQFEALERMGCDEVQGYLFGHPLPADAFAALLRRQAASDDLGWALGPSALLRPPGGTSVALSPT